jgi:hypothetical protein
MLVSGFLVRKFIIKDHELRIRNMFTRITLQEAKWLDKRVFDANMLTALRGGNLVNTFDTIERTMTMKGKILGWIAAASQVVWRSKENETKISFQSCGNRTSELEITTGEHHIEIQIILYAESHTPQNVVTDW